MNDPVNIDISVPPRPLLDVDLHHPPVFMMFMFEDVSPPPMLDELVFDFRRCDFDSLNESLAAVDWPSVLYGSTDHVVEAFYGKLHELFRATVPVKKRRSRIGVSQPWLNPELRNLRNRLRKARKRFRNGHDMTVSLEVRDLESAYNTLHVTSFCDYINRIQDNARTDPLSFWSHVRQRKGTQSIPQVTTYDDETAETPNAVAMQFSTFFQSVLSTNTPPLCESFLSSLPNRDFNLPLLNFSSNDVFRKMSTLDETKGPGPDGIPPILDKKCADPLSVPISIIFNNR
ncbi:uncharacterized protein LOC129743322 [Uranotaenia lowii]|uniref:uncharacterized protein LOC129743322 n=1 Tax=Uranotaenia lowii TaxID=190385 RepID=UPI00247AFFD3|nr:uncharacterized protein LOC129743322 [Uranotaenia lowii]